MYPFPQKIFADGGYQGPVFQKALAKALPHLKIAIVKRSDQAYNGPSLRKNVTHITPMPPSRSVVDRSEWAR